MVVHAIVSMVERSDSVYSVPNVSITQPLQPYFRKRDLIGYLRSKVRNSRTSRGLAVTYSKSLKLTLVIYLAVPRDNNEVRISKFKISGWLSDLAFLRVVDAHLGVINNFNQGTKYSYFAINTELNAQCEITPFVEIDINKYLAFKPCGRKWYQKLKC